MRETSSASRLLAALLVAACSIPLWAGEHSERHEGRREGGSLPALEQRAWQTECGACHAAYHPAFLPERSWRKLMTDLDHHFGENASLDAPTANRIAEFLAANAADRGNSRRGRKVAASVAPTQTPLRISETPWFVRKHGEVRAEVWKRKSVGSAANCGACHPGAERNDYDEHAIRIPR